MISINGSNPVGPNCRGYSPEAKVKDDASALSTALKRLEAFIHEADQDPGSYDTVTLEVLMEKVEGIKGALEKDLKAVEKTNPKMYKQCQDALRHIETALDYIKTGNLGSPDTLTQLTDADIILYKVFISP